MSDNEEVEVEPVQGYQVLPKEVVEEIGSIKLFNKWYVKSRRNPRKMLIVVCFRSYEDVEIRDISLT
jgi:small subunit ribosomal protein S5e